ncbi:MAG: 1-deoxy-D-xylulose-5-phosphate synthase [Spirochaetaceae bacterium]|jgi:1-deoxy-D-xylulose-5-phosphate synthase|nr:1-deoxy-D-xylulose-5-phosphate synthase [Spirochaetaceae bacterium]
MELSQILPGITSPADLQRLTHRELRLLSREIRETIIEVVGANGGHLASNLGVVELTIALHRVFGSPDDAFVWDVGHQSYTHKLLTGRFSRFSTLRRRGGLAGFPKRSESEHDLFDTGHSSTSISSALGLLKGRRLSGKNGKVIAVIGDGALSGGMAFEALSHAGQLGDDLIVILNDNRMSIGENFGALSRYLSRLTMTTSYQLFRTNVDKVISSIPLVGKSLSNFIFRFKRGLKGLFLKDNLFSDLGFEYAGPFNGHNIEELEKILERVKLLKRPVVVHVVTQKGRGYSPAENDPAKFHGIGPFCTTDGIVEKFDVLSFTEVFSRSITALAEENSKIVAITAAMAKGTGLAVFQQRYPDRFFDVDIAEQHAVTFAGGLALAGMKPVVAIYSTFMQRAVDQVIHDIALQDAGVVFMLDRSGAVPDDGETHQGIYDIALFRPVPGISMLAPASAAELELFLSWAVCQPGSVVIRYPKNPCPQELSAFSEPLVCGRGVLVGAERSLAGSVSAEFGSSEALIVCTGGIFPEVYGAAKILAGDGIAADIYNLRFIKPLDEGYFISLASRYSSVLFVEDGAVTGGIGEFLESLLLKAFPAVHTGVCGFPDRFVAQGKRFEILSEIGLDSCSLADRVRSLHYKESSYVSSISYSSGAAAAYN